jgi:dGTPase
MTKLARASFRERIERAEEARHSSLATPSYPARRLREEPDSDHRTPFQRDRDRIVHSKAFRRLKHKTQVFIAPEGDHYRTRLTHTLETCGIARTVARALGLNEDLTEAIGLGHDLGHPPFGHVGEGVLDACASAGSTRSATTSTRCAWSTRSSGSTSPSRCATGS